jgi:polyisoprenoid-binding protein YceI
MTTLRPLMLSIGLLVSSWTAQAAHYQSVQPDKSSLSFTYRQMGVPMEGRFKKFSTQLSFDPQKPQLAKVQLDIDMTQIDAGSAEADQEAKGKSWFNASAFPKATFTVQQVKVTGANQFDVVGQLTLKGQTREVRFPLKHAPQGPQGLLSGEFTIKRGDFAIGEGMWSKFDTIANDVQIRFQLIAQPGQ